jgi:RNase P subunit RPR2
MSTYKVEIGSKCDDCDKVLSADERQRNEVEKEDQDGNALWWCDSCAEEHSRGRLMMGPWDRYYNP